MGNRLGVSARTIHIMTNINQTMYQQQQPTATGKNQWEQQQIAYFALTGLCACVSVSMYWHENVIRVWLIALVSNRTQAHNNVRYYLMAVNPSHKTLLFPCNYSISCTRSPYYLFVELEKFTSSEILCHGNMFHIVSAWHCIQSYGIILRSVRRHQLIECENDCIINSLAFGNATGWIARERARGKNKILSDYEY